MVPVAAEVSGKVQTVHIRDDDQVEPGQPLFDIDPEQYDIALQRARSDYESVRRSVNAAAAGVEAARASAARRPRPVSPWRTSDATARNGCTRRIPARSPCGASRLRNPHARNRAAKFARAEADLRSCRGDGGRKRRRATPRSRARRQQWRRPSSTCTHQRPRTGARSRDRSAGRRRQLRPGGRAGHDADRGARRLDQRRHDREQPRPHRPGDEAAIVLDVLPGEVLKGRVRSVGGASTPARRPRPERCRRSTTTATGCARRSASRCRSSSTRRESRAAACASEVRPRSWSTPATIR